MAKKLLFSKRHRLANEFLEWASPKNYMLDAYNVITWLEGEGLLNVVKIQKRLSKPKTEAKR